ncbi:MAG: Xaa-Pro aminopeptidase [Porticoccaceae bacterium]
MITRQEFAKRRETLIELMAENSIAIVAAAPERVRNRDVHYPYRQDSDFYYLTGFPEPEAVLVLVPGREQGQFLMFCRDRNLEREIWDGYRAGPEGACEEYGADDAFPIDDIDEILPGLLEGRDRVYYAMGKDPAFDRHLMEWVNNIRSRSRAGATPPGEFVDLDHLLHELRLFKSAAEQKIMRTAGEISARAHCRAMQVCRPGMYEYQLQAEIEHEFAMAGSRFPAYGSIVGGGANGCILHYVENSARLQDGDLVLIDAGCELYHYASDITRTFPVNGKFTAEQKALYDVVLEAQMKAIEVCMPGNHWNEPHQVTVKVIAQGLIDLGILQGSRDEVIESGAYRDFYMHRAGHWLGMDVHDVGDYKVHDEWRVLEPGMVLTVEPGIYIGRDCHQVDPRWRGIGIRIEDDVLIKSKGYTVLSADVPKTTDDIEALMAG